MISLVSGTINNNLANFSAAVDRISDPDTIATIDDIVALKEARVATEIGVAVLKKINETQRLVDVIA